MSLFSGCLILVLSLSILGGGFGAPSRAPNRAPVKAPSRAPAKAPVRAPARAPAAARASCPYNYTVQPGDTYCVISSKVGISTARLLAANPSTSLAEVSPGKNFRVPCKPQTDCCPTYIIAAAQGTGTGYNATPAPRVAPSKAPSRAPLPSLRAPVPARRAPAPTRAPARVAPSTSIAG